MTKNVYIIVFKVIICTLLITGCSPKSSYNVKTFLFDGVPEPIIAQEIDSLALDTLSLTMQDSIKAIKKPQEIIHEPYKEKKCNTCHKKYTRSQSMANNKALCYTCHDAFENQYQTLHGPVAVGYCTQCHNPHKSKNEALLLQNDDELCYNCHNQEYIAATTIHKTIEDKQCITCHNAHGGNNSTFLAIGSCFECHDNYNKTYTILHGPVAAGLCAPCHDNHKSKQPHLLKITGNSLCFNCHNKKDVDKIKVHPKTRTQQCTDCHNPHGGQKSFLLTNTYK